jgi:hypothetical protein
MNTLDSIKLYYFKSIYESKVLTSNQKLTKLKQIKESKTYNEIEKVLTEIPIISVDPIVMHISSGIVLAVIILQHAYQKYVSLYKRLMVSCDEAPNRYKCHHHARLQAKEAQLRALVDHRAKCRNKGSSKQQQTCQKKVDEKIKLVRMDVVQIRAKKPAAF